MTTDDLFVPNPFALDDKTQRTCGECLKCKPVAEFYRDGTDGDGETKYRRNCKECYRVTRLRADIAKREPVRPAARSRTRRKKK